MSFYNMVFGRNPLSSLILAMIGRHPGDFIRFRDCYVADGKICVYTRNGGGNRDCYCHEYGEESRETCTGCFMAGVVQSFPHYKFDRDDDFDSTYATIYFKFPEEFRLELEAMDSGKPWDPDGSWAAAIKALGEGQLPEVERRMAPVLEKIAAFLAPPSREPGEGGAGG